MGRDRAGHLVIAHEFLDYGWWEAIVIARKDNVFTLRYRDFPSLPKFFRDRFGIALMYPQAQTPAARRGAGMSSGQAHLVIAHELPADGWWEAIVLERKDDAFTLQFRDYIDLPHVVRHKSGIALMHSPTKENSLPDRRSRPDARPLSLRPRTSPNQKSGGPMDTKTARIRALNDELRQNFAGGAAVMTPGIAALGAEAVARIVKTVAVFDDFCHANDPHEEHDFGASDADGQRVFFKIDYYDESLSTTPRPG